MWEGSSNYLSQSLTKEVFLFPIKLVDLVG